ncbi:hypothetical protein LPB41_22150 [Thalassospira sp. MA62]|nr:hypothetical protein [Thalassospira sp. MA62]
MEPLASPYPVYTRTAREIAPQNRLSAPEQSQNSAASSSNNRQTDLLRGSSNTFANLQGSLGSASDLVGQASRDLSRIGTVLDDIDALVRTAEENSNLSTRQRAQIDAQIEDFLTEIDDIASNSNFDGEDLLNADRTVTLQVGSGTGSDNRIDVELFASDSESLAAGLSSISVADDSTLADARTLVDAAQDAVRTREISLSSDQGSIETARDQNRLAQAGNETILQAQLAASETTSREDTRAQISENLQAYLGNIANQLAELTVSVGGVALPEPRPDPVPEPEADQTGLVYDPTQQDDTPPFGTLPGTPIGGIGSPSFGGYDSGGNGQAIGDTNSGLAGGSATRGASRVSFDA